MMDKQKITGIALFCVTLSRLANLLDNCQHFVGVSH